MSGSTRAPDGPHDAALRAIAHDARLDHLNRSDARHALRLAVDALVLLLGCRCALQAQGADGTARWHQGDAAFGNVPAAGWAVLPLTRLGRQVGTLALERETRADGMGRLLDPLLPALGALLLHDANARPGTGAASLVAMIRAALEGAGTFVWEWDIESDRLGDIDRGLQELGYPTGAANATQDAWNRLIHPDDLDANHAAYLRHARGEDSVYEHACRIRANDGAWRWYLERGRIVEWHADGRPRGMVGIQTDITERRANDDRVSQATSRLERIARHVPGVLFRFESARDGSARFAYISERIGPVFGIGADAVTTDAAALYRVMLREDRHPVAASIALSRRTLCEWRREFRIRHADGALRWIVGAATPQHEADGGVAWHGHFEDVTELRELEAARREAAAAAAATRAALADRTRLRQVLLNLLSNAVKYNRQDGTVAVEVDGGDTGHVTLCVRDSGVGIAPEDLGQVFEPFERGVHEGSGIEGSGIGIGMSVTRSLVQLTNGHIEGQSSPRGRLGLHRHAAGGARALTHPYNLRPWSPRCRTPASSS